jgi:hypothetical protein
MDSVELKKRTMHYPFGFDSGSIEMQLVQERKLQRAICACGHPATSHTLSVESGVTTCNLPKSFCPCGGLMVVVEAGDKRSFGFLTTGPDGLHALTKGIRKALRNGAQVEPARDNVCFSCKKLATRLIAVAINRDGFLAHTPQATNGLVCEECCDQLKAGVKIGDLVQN